MLVRIITEIFWLSNYAQIFLPDCYVNDSRVYDFHRTSLFLLSGDKFSRRGTLEGGFVSPNHSRLLFQKRIWEYLAKLEEQETELAQVRTQLQSLDGDVTQVLSELQKLETTQVQLR